jgi:hypothetical protein
MTNNNERQFLMNTLKCEYAGKSLAETDQVIGLETNFQYWKELNEEHYAATSTDILQPVSPAYTAMQYADGFTAAVAYKGRDYSAFVMGFPFECIKDGQKRSSIMQGLLNYLIK